MNFVYGYDEALPTRGADSEQVMQTVAAVSRTGAAVDLLTLRPRDGEAMSAGELKDHYGVSGPFAIDQIGRRSRNRVVEKLAHARRVAGDRRGRDRVIHTRNLSIAAACLAAGRPVLYDTYRPWPRQYPPMAPPMRLAARRDNLVGVIVHSAHAAAAYLEAGIDADKIAVVHNGFDPARLEPALDRAEARAMLGLDPEAPLVTYTGRVDPEKGLDLVIEMARRCPEVRFLIVGSRDRNGPLERAGAAVANLAFVPWQPYSATARYLYASDVLLTPPSLQPLERAGNTVLPMKLFSYLAAGRVILAPRAPDTAELLEHEVNAYLTAPGDVAGAVAALRRIVASPELSRAIAAGALATASRYTWDARADKILEFVAARI